LIDEFKKYLLYREYKSFSTIKTYSKCIDEFIKWYYSSKNKEILTLDREVINSYKNYLISVKRKKTQTVNVILCALSIFNRFIRHKNGPKNYIQT
jgi:site-specific recombinase XerD